jgi:hypothetical protein
VRVEDSPDLLEWRPAPLSEPQPLVVEEGSFHRMTFALGDPPSLGIRFYRLAVSQNDFDEL